ncbi:flagellin [Methylomagnum ishizawai]|uniref:Flagellin n=1 Tax=Methylomagnum ishizawai TaxID=1760988 RepID=A0A1Y6D5E5_9GAMM|nr:flagellin [Methylomagnum ishizawai]SMF95772.1 flagellin [Methylomagnum ishizawai]
MPMYINTNVTSLTTQMQLNKSQMSQQTAMTRLSSGLRINSAADDAAGLAISDRMSAQVTGMNQAVRNANDGISLAQTATGALGQITNSLQRLRELSVQSSNATNTASDRAALQQEAGQLLSEIDRVAGQTQFNGITLLDGSFKQQSFQVGANAGQTISVNVSGAKASQLGTNNAAALTAKGNSAAINSGDLIINGVAIRSSSASDDLASYPASSKSSSAIAKVAAINASTAQTGVTATADVNTVAGATQVAPKFAGDAGSGTLTINGVQTAKISLTADLASNRAAVAQAINAISDKTGITANDTGSTDTGVSLSAADGRNVTVKYSAPTDANTRFDASLTGVRALGTEDSSVGVGNVLQGTTMTGANSSGSFTINGVGTSIVNTSSDTVTTRASVVAAINAISDKTGVTAVDSGSDADGVKLVAADGRAIEISRTVVSGTFDATTTGVSAGRGTNSTLAQTQVAATTTTAEGAANTENLTINGQSISFDAGSATLTADLADAINNVSVQTGVKADTATLAMNTATGDGRDITISSEGNATTGAGALLADDLGYAAQSGTMTIHSGATAATAFAAGSAFSFAINGKTYNVATTDTSATLAATINLDTATTGITATDSSGQLQLQAADGSDIVLSGNLGDMASATAGTTLGFSNTSTDVVSAGFTISGEASAATANGKGLENNWTSLNTVSTTASDTLQLSINGVKTAAITGTGTSSDDADTIVAAVNAISNQTGITASQTGGALTFNSKDGRQIDLTGSTINGNNSTTSVAAKLGMTMDVDGNFSKGATAVRDMATANNAVGGTVDNTGTLGDNSIIVVNGVTASANVDLSSTDAGTNAGNIVKAVNSVSTQTGVSAALNEAGDGVVFTSSSGGTIDLTGSKSNGMALTAGQLGLDSLSNTQGSNAAEGTNYGSYTLTSNEKIEITAGSGTGVSVAHAGLASGTYSAQTAYTSTTSNNGQAIQSGDAKINGVLIGASTAASDTASNYASVVSSEQAAKWTAASAISKVAAINAISEKSGVTATVNATQADGSDMTGSAAGTGTITINGQNTSVIASVGGGNDIDAATTRANVVKAINAISEQTGVRAVDTNSTTSGVQLVADDGRNVNIQFNGGLSGANTGLVSNNTTTTVTGTGPTATAAKQTGSLSINGVSTGTFSLNSSSDGAGYTSAVQGQDLANAINSIADKTGVTATADSTTGALTLKAASGQNISVDFGGSMTASLTGLKAGTTSGSSATAFGTYTLSSAATFSVDKGSTGGLGVDNTGLSVGTYGSGKTGMSLDKLDISTAEGAQKAITALDNALAQVDSNQANLGAIQNRFNSTISALQSTSTNLTAARSRIQDADFASETASLSRAQVLQQAGTAMLAQANSSSQSVLSLLR